MRKTFSIKKVAMATIIAVAILIFNSACSSSGKNVVIDARFLNMNQANFYVYSPDGIIDGIDTIQVQGGRFTYEKEIMTEGTLVIVFPNYAEAPIFVEPGASIRIEANAAHLKEIEITGTDANEEFTEWRKNSNQLSPAEMRKHAEMFINDHPESPASRWLLRQHFILCQKPDFRKARKLLRKMMEATDNNIQVSKMAALLNNTNMLQIGDKLPKFSAKDINGKPVLNGQLLKGKTVICVWASWNYESLNILRMLANNQSYAADSAKINNVLTICLDPNVKDCRRMMKQNAAEDLTTICDTLMWDSPLIKTLGINNLPDNIKLKDGKIVAMHVPYDELTK